MASWPGVSEPGDPNTPPLVARTTQLPTGGPMFKKTIVGVVAGFVLTAGAVSAEAVQPVHQSASSQQSFSVAKRCARYPASVFTRTRLGISRHVQHQGQRNTATVKVTSNAGKVRDR